MPGYSGGAGVKTRVVWLALAAFASAAHADDLVTEVAHHRQLPIKHPIAIEKLDADAFAQRTHAVPAADPWGVAGAAPQLDAVFDGSAVVATQDASELAIAAAIDRALVEQSFGAAPLEPEARRARELVETGDAEALAIELALARAGKPPPWDDDELVAQLVADRPELAYIAARRRRGWRAVDAALKKPPTTTAEILHGTRVASVAVELAARDGWTVASTDAWGELGTRAFLTAHGLEPVAAAEATAGWRGDRVIACTRGARTMGLVRSEWASEADAERARAAIAVALGQAVVGVAIDDTHWLALDGSIASVERSGTTITAAIGVPLYEPGSRQR